LSAGEYLLTSLQHRQGWSTAPVTGAAAGKHQSKPLHSQQKSRSVTRWQDTGSTFAKTKVSPTDLIIFANVAHGNESCGQRRSRQHFIILETLLTVPLMTATTSSFPRVLWEKTPSALFT